MASNVFLFTGEETYLIKEQIRLWKDQFKSRQGSDINLTMLDGEKSSVSDILSSIETMPFLGDKRLIFIENLPEAPRAKSSEDDEEVGEYDGLAEALEKAPESSVVVFVQPMPDRRKSFYKKLSKIAQIKEFAPLASGPLTAWVMAEVHKNGGKIDAGAAEYLVSFAGSSLWRLSHEIHKLVSYLEKAPITKDAIDHVVIPLMEANIFNLTDALSARNPKRAIECLHRTMAAGEDLFQVFYMIVRQFRLFLQLHSYLSLYPTATHVSMASALKLHPFVVKNTLNQLRAFKLIELKQAYEQLQDIDWALKTSRIKITADDQDELALALERFILEFASANQHR